MVAITVHCACAWADVNVTISDQYAEYDVVINYMPDIQKVWDADSALGGVVVTNTDASPVLLSGNPRECITWPE